MKFAIGDIIISNDRVIDDAGTVRSGEDWCYPNFKYKIVGNVPENKFYEIEGITNGRRKFFLNYELTDRSYHLHDDPCGKCINKCRRKEGKCEFYEV